MSWMFGHKGGSGWLLSPAGSFSRLAPNENSRRAISCCCVPGTQAAMTRRRTANEPHFLSDFAQPRYVQAKQNKTKMCMSVFILIAMFFATEAVRYPRSAVLLANYKSGNFLVVQRGAEEKWFETRTNRWGRAMCSEHEH